MSKTTAIGSIAGGLMLVQIDYTKLGNFDHGEIAKLAVGIMIGLFGYFSADRPASAPGDPEDKRETKGVEPGKDPLK